MRQSAQRVFADKHRYFRIMLPFALASALVGLCLMLWGFARGEWSLAIPSYPSGRWRLMVGSIVLAGGTLLTIVTLVIPSLLPPETVRPSTATLSDPIQPVLTGQGITQ
jgi:hypothetical protein